MSASVRQDPTTLRRLYGRQQGPKLRGRQAQLIEELLPKLQVQATGALAPADVFGKAISALWLEIGFGKGEHMIAHAKAHPSLGYIGCEPYANGMASALGQIEDEGLTNIRLHRGDALDVIERLPAQSLDRVFLLHPDPWPKYRHAKRRFVNPGPIALLADRMKPGALLRIGTDDVTYVRWTLQQMAAQSAFDWLAEGPNDWQVRPDDWPQTRYEAWAKSIGKEVWYLQYQRRE